MTDDTTVDTLGLETTLRASEEKGSEHPRLTSCGSSPESLDARPINAYERKLLTHFSQLFHVIYTDLLLADGRGNCHCLQKLFTENLKKIKTLGKILEGGDSVRNKAENSCLCTG